MRTLGINEKKTVIEKRESVQSNFGEKFDWQCKKIAYDSITGNYDEKTV